MSGQLRLAMGRENRVLGGGRGLLALAGIVVTGLLMPSVGAAAAPKDSCVSCHADTKFLVQNKKLYDYYQNWDLGVHNEAGVTCTDCHGGNANASGKKAAHQGVAMGAAGARSAVNFRNIPATCAGCHTRVAEGYGKSEHAKHLSGKGGIQGPSCVTCHGSVNAAVVSAGKVREVCSTCHNTRTKNRPDVPERAGYILSRYLSIERIYRYVARKADVEKSRAFFKEIDPLRAELGYEWHTFDLDKAAGKTRTLLEALKRERDAIRGKTPAK